MTTKSSGDVRSLYALFVANAISLTGTFLSSVAMTWFVLELTGSAALTGLAAGVQLVPLLLAGLFGGPLIDRLGFRRTSILSDVLSGLTIALIPLLHVLGTLPYPLLVALMFLAALFETPGGAARESLAPELAERAGWPLARVNAALSAIRRFAILLGPILGGGLIAVLGVTPVLWLDAASFAVSALIMTVAVRGGRVAGRRDHAYRRDLREGFAFLSRSRGLLSLVAVFCGSNLLLNPIFIVILPALVREMYGNPALLGGLISAFGGGTMLGVILYGVLAPRLPKASTLVGCLALLAAVLWLLALVPPAIAVLAVLLALLGFVMGPLGPVVATTLGERTPPELRGRVFALFGALVNAGIPVGVGLGGLAMQRFGAGVTFAGIATLFTLLALFTWRAQGVRVALTPPASA